MFRTNSNQDRVNYSNLLLPPDNYTLEKAVGTTYSLDLEALTAVSIALGLKENMDSELLNNPISMLNALQKVSDKILIFCETGQINSARNKSPLFLLLEKMVVPVALSKKRGMSRYPAFHPKTWILQYRNPEGKRRYRFVVLSRNLTFDRSWDVSLCLDSSDEIIQTEKTAPIIHFLDYLRGQVGNTITDFRRKRSMIRSFCSELEHVSFAVNNSKFSEDFTIMPLGIGNNGYDMSRDPLFCQKLWSADYSFHELVAISPFLSASVVDYWNRQEHSLKDTTRVLITRKSELSKLAPNQVSGFKIYTLKDDIVDGENAVSEENEEKKQQDIHAKLYLRRKNSDVDLYIGSMNASHSAVNSNVEMMIRLRTKPRYLNSEILLKELFCGPADGIENPFQEVIVQEEKSEQGEDEESLLERQIKEICRLPLRAEVTQRGNKFDARVFSGLQKEKEWANIMIAPLRRDIWIPFQQEMLFQELDILQLSEFYQIRAEGENACITRVIMIPTTGIPEERESTVVNSVVKDKKSFVEYIAFILGDDHLMSMLEENMIGSSGFLGTPSERVPALYEKMLKTAVEEPERLKEIDYLLKMIHNENIIPDEFRKLYETFRTTLRLK